VVSIVTEVDCLSSLSIVSGCSEIAMVRPELIPYEGQFKNISLLDVKSMVHPCVKMINKKVFVPNNTYISSKKKELSGKSSASH
jgi:DNA mismatch repair ATPase MutS